MDAEASVPLILQVEPCQEDPTRYRWAIYDHIVRQCPYSLPNEQAALTQGQAALQEARAIWRDTR